MNEQESHNKEKKHRKWPWIVPLCVIVVLGLARLALMTGYVHRIVKNKIVGIANEKLNVHLSIGDLSGNLYRRVTLTDVALTAHDSTVARVDTLYLKYHPLSYFSSAFKIEEIRVTAPLIKIRQEPDSTWNYEHWMKPSEGGGFPPISIADFSLSSGQVDVANAPIEQESSFVIDDLNLATSDLFYSEDHYKATVDSLSLDIEDTHLGAPVSVYTSARASDSSFTLHKLAITTAHSALSASGKVSLIDSTAHLIAKAQPLGWKDIAAYDKDLSLHKNINSTLKLNGDIHQFAVHLGVNTEGIDHLSLDSQFSGGPEIVLTSLKIAAKRLDLEKLMGDTTAQRLQDLKLQAQGYVPIEDYEKGQIKGTLSAKDIHESTYHLDALQGSFSLDKGNTKIQLKPIEKGEYIIADAHISQVWSDQPAVLVSVKGSAINPAVWMQDKDYKGSVNFNGKITGTGLYPQQEFWGYQLAITNSRLMDQPLDKATFTGRFNQDTITNQSDVLIAKSALHLKARVQHFQETPDFSYTVIARHLNLADINGLEAYPSSINGTIQGHGRGSSLQDMQLQTSMAIDSSTLKKEPVQKLTIDANVADSVVTVQQAELQSAVADGSLSGHIHLQDFYNPDNRLQFQAQIKDLSPFASAAGVDVLEAHGTLKGQVNAVTPDSLVFNSTMHLADVNYGNEVTAKKIGGTARVTLEEHPQYAVDIDIGQPSMSSIDLQNISLSTKGRMADTTTSGSYQVQLTGAGQSRISQAGTYQAGSNLTAVKLTKFTLSGAKQTLVLARPFHARMVNDVLHTDTLQLHSKSDSSLVELAVPYADSLRQRGYIKAVNVHLSPIQQAVLQESYVKGTLFAAMRFNRTDTSITASGNLELANLLFAGGKLDSLQLQADIKNKRLEGSLTARKDGGTLMEGKVDIPFNLQNSKSPEKGYFQKKVNGYLTVRPVPLSEFHGWLKQAGMSDLKGLFQFNGSLKGEAGQPKLDARMSLREGSLSGIPIDSLIASVNYQHKKSALNLKASLTSLHQKAVELDGSIPLKVDLQHLDVALPGPKDTISVDMKANNFDLKSMNDFMNHAMARNLEGRIDGNVHVSGPRDALQINGALHLKKGAVRIVNAGIRLDHMHSTLQFQPDKLVLSDLHVESGQGSMNVKGTLGMKELVPGKLDLSMKAKNFKILNTDDYKALANADMSINGSVTSPKVSGSLELINGSINLNNFGAKSVEQVQLDTTLTPETQTSLYDSLSLDMSVSINRRFFVHNQRYLKMEIGLKGNLNIEKQKSKDLHIFGSLSTTKGYAEPLGKHFALKEGELTFTGPPANPELNIRTLYEPPQTDQNIKIWYIIKGTVEDPKFEYESDPPMELSSIISYTLFGEPMFKLNSSAQSVSNSLGSKVVSNFAMHFLANRIESLATEKLGVDVVKIENTRVGGKTGTAITTGWYINPKVFFAIQNVITGSTPKPGFYLEYYLRKNLKLILSQGTGNRQGVGADLQWKHDY